MENHFLYFTVTYRNINNQSDLLKITPISFLSFLDFITIDKIREGGLFTFTNVRKQMLTYVLSLLKTLPGATYRQAAAQQQHTAVNTPCIL